jgi:hypothetical protein
METAVARHLGDALDAARIKPLAPLFLDTVKIAAASWPFLRRLPL